jgi:DeoR family transcriptional regulator, aga operon transcriptional repressor
MTALRAKTLSKTAAGPARLAPVDAAAPVAAERRRLVRRFLVENGSVRVAHLARQLAVSEETVRRDLRALADEGIAKTVHGGAILLADGPAALGVPPVDRREAVQQQAKQWIGAAAARHVEDGQVVILDAGTTTVAVAHHLRQHRKLTIVTNSLVVAQVSATTPESDIYVVGGKLVAESLSLIGVQAHRDLAKVNADWAFLGAAAIHAGSGFTSADPYEAEVKRAMIRAARQVAIVADHTKFDARRFASFAEAGDVHYLFTTPGLPAPARRWLEKAGVKIVLCGDPSSTQEAP